MNQNVINLIIILKDDITKFNIVAENNINQHPSPHLLPMDW